MDDSSPAKRNPVSCTECQRRKQRCNRTWPCDRCFRRRISHQCHFKTKATEQVRSSLCVKASDTLKRLQPDPVSTTSRPPDHDDGSTITTDDAITAWGFMPEQEHFNLGSVATPVPLAALVSSASAFHDQLHEDLTEAIAVLPSRAVTGGQPVFCTDLRPPLTHTDTLIQNFVHNVNYFHYALYPPQFLTDYTDWWSKRANHLTLSPAFTCLLLKVCACSAQYLEGATRLQIEAELGEGIEILANRYHAAARGLSRCISPGNGGLTQVQQLFLSVPWYKGVSKFVEAWHALGTTVREAQEIGLHKDSFGRNCSEFDLEMRRRLWCVVYLWDWYLSRWLSRPLLIDQRSCAVTVPCINLEQSDQCPGPPSPFTPVALQYRLALQLSDDSTRRIHDPIMAATVLKQIEAWTETFPQVYRTSSPDTSWDAEHPYLPFQRKHLHLMSNLFKLSPVKYFLIKDPREDFTQLESHLRAAGVEVCIHVVKAAHELFGLMFSPAARGFIVICVAFIATTLLISALMRDTEKTLPHRELILESVHLTLDMAYQLREVTAAGRVAYNILTGLVRSLPLYPDEVDLIRFGACTQPNVFPSEYQVRLLRMSSDHVTTTGSSGVAAEGVVDHHGELSPSNNSLSSGAVNSGNIPLCGPSNKGKEDAAIVMPTEEDFTNTDWSALAEIWGTLDPVFVQ